MEKHDLRDFRLLKAKASRDFAFVGAVEIWRLRFVGRPEIMAEGAGHSARDRVRGHSVYSR